MEEQPQRQLPNGNLTKVYNATSRSFFDTRCVVLKDKKGLKSPNGVCFVTRNLVPARRVSATAPADT